MKSNRIYRLLKKLIGHPLLSTSLLKESLCIFCYHEISDNPSDFCKEYNLNVFPDNFEKQLDLIGEHFNIISPLQILDGKYTAPAALITFDDGMQGYFRNAVPILQKKNIPSIIFLNMAPVEGEIFWSGLITYLTNYDPEFKEVLRQSVKVGNATSPFLHCDRETVNNYLVSQTSCELVDESRRYYGDFATLDDLCSVGDNHLVFFGNHLYNHYNVVTLTDEELEEEYFVNEERILGYPNGLSFFSYPFGQPGTCFSEYHTEKICSFGAKAIFCSSGRVNKVGQDCFYDRITIDNEAKTINDLFAKFQFSRLKNLMNII